MKKDLNKIIDDLMLAAQSYKERGDFIAALNHFDKILKLDKNNKKVFNNIANTYKEAKKFDEAIEYYHKSINLDTSYLIPKINLSILYHDLGNLDKAEKLYKEIINLDKYNFAVYFNLARINFDYFDQGKIDFVEKSISNEKLDNFNKASGYFLLAKYQQKQKNFDKEMLFLKKGHDHFCKSIHINTYQQNLNYWLNIIPKKYLKFEIIKSRENNQNNSNVNPIFIIGMPRSGSTLIESIISSGKIKIPNGGETATINRSLLKNYKRSLIIDNLDKISVNKNILKKEILYDYKNLNLLKKDKKFFFTDKSLENFFYIDIILELFPNAKFINCMRNKIDNILAIYQNFFTKMSWVHSIENIIIYFDNYLNVMDHFNQKYSDKIFSVELEKLTLDSKNVSQKLFEFCELEWSSESLEFYKRKDLYSSTASNIQIREKIYDYNKLKYNDYKKYLKEFEQKYEWLET